MTATQDSKLRTIKQIVSDQRVVLMGILNVTPDSFSDGGRFVTVDDAIEQTEKMMDEGAHIIDIGGESTRPNAEAVSLDEELSRVMPVIEALAQSDDVLISIDTSKPEVMRAAIEAGAVMVNDVNALRAEGGIDICVRHDVPVCLMHMKGQPRTMQDDPQYDDVVSEVSAFLQQRVKDCVELGMNPERIILDPGFGFGKTLEQNLLLLKHFEELSSLNFPLMLGISRKSMLGMITNAEVEERVAPGLAATVVAYQKGVRFFRTHDVKQTRDALLVCEAIETSIG